MSLLKDRKMSPAVQDRELLISCRATHSHRVNLTTPEQQMRPSAELTLLTSVRSDAKVKQHFSVSAADPQGFHFATCQSHAPDQQDA